MSAPAQRILIAGLGNELLGDDGVGVHAVRLIRARRPSFWGREVHVLEVGVAVLDALAVLERVDRVLAIDAMRAGGVPGTLYAVAESGIDDWDRRSGMHEMGLIGAMRLMTGPKPRVAVLGVEPEHIDYGMELSETVRRMVPSVAAAAIDCVRRWIESPVQTEQSLRTGSA
jgi:hydrogenase maturation protease